MFRSDESDIIAFIDQSITDNCEGLMVKLLDHGQNSRYEPDKRSQAWLKLKKDYLDGMAGTFDLVPVGNS
jgi:DNA ligase-1